MRSLLIVLIWALSFPATAGQPCFQQLNLTTPNTTEGLITYLSSLLEQRVIGVTEISQLVLSLESGQVTNPFTEIQATIDSKAFIHRQEIQRQLLNPHLDRARLLRWIKDLMAGKLSVQIARENAQALTHDLYQKIDFQPVPGGTVRLDGHKKEVAPFEMMTTPVTQKQWADIMGENPSFFQDWPGSMEIRYGEKAIQMQPDHPVEQVDWWSAVNFANELSKRAGLTPAYDLSAITFIPNNPAGGHMLYRKGLLKINAPNEDIFQTAGYRLLTRKELEYILSISTNKTRIDTSDGRLHSVTDFPPLIIGGASFYDFFGNLSQWLYDKNMFEVYERASFNGSAGPDSLRYEYKEERLTQHFLGFRLVRSLK